MICSGCGKDIPFVGEVCPHCNRKKDKDQEEFGTAMVIAIIGMIIGYFTIGFFGIFIGGFFGVIVGCIVAFTISAKNKKTEPPEVKIVSSASSRSSPKPINEGNNAIKRLTDLETLKTKGLITEDEFQSRRKVILDSI